MPYLLIIELKEKIFDYSNIARYTVSKLSTSSIQASCILSNDYNGIVSSISDAADSYRGRGVSRVRDHP